MNRSFKFLAATLLVFFFVGCTEDAVKEKPIPPDDLSNGPWKHQQGGAKPPQ